MIPKQDRIIYAQVPFCYPSPQASTAVTHRTGPPHENTGPRWLLAGVSLLLLSATVQAVPYRLVKIADSLTEVPASNGRFWSLQAPAIDEAGNVAFLAYGSNGEHGIYVTQSETGLSRVADTRTAIPDGYGRFTRFSAPSIDNGKVAFLAFGKRSQRGIYSNLDDSLASVASNAMKSPEGFHFSGFADLALKDAKLAFRARDDDGSVGIFLYDEGLQEVVSQKHALPDGLGQISDIEALSFDGDQLAFVARSNRFQSGIFVENEGLMRVADTRSNTANENPDFTRFQDVRISDGELVFRGDNHQSSALYGWKDDPKTPSDKPSSIPLSGPFDQYAFADGNLAFTHNGLYTLVDGVMNKVVSLGDELEDRTVSNVVLWKQGYNGQSVAFNVSFADGSQAIYRADQAPGIPEPGSSLMFILGLGLVAAMNPRSQRR